MTLTKIPEPLEQAMGSLLQESGPIEGVLDLDLYRVQIALLWIQITLDPEIIGVRAQDLETLHDLVNAELLQTPNIAQDLLAIFAFLVSVDGQQAMLRLKVGSHQRELLDYFGTMIVHPVEHKRRMQAAREEAGDC